MLRNGCHRVTFLELPQKGDAAQPHQSAILLLSRVTPEGGREVRQYAEFRCESCEHEFAEGLPPICEDLPRCPLCGDTSRLYVLLEAKQESRWAAMSVGGLLAAVDLAWQLWPF